jgi:rhodanese-related sulfurtransferase
MEFREVGLKRNSQCAVCGDSPTQTELVDYDVFCGLEPDGGGRVRDPLPQRTPREVEASVTGGAADFEGSQEAPFLLDVREPHEWEIGNLEKWGAILVPYTQVFQRLEEIPSDRPIVVYCHLGVRSAIIAGQLQDRGYSQVANLKGGYRAWVDEVDPSLSRY